MIGVGVVGAVGAVGTFSWIAGALQLVVPSYALRLIRRFGTQQVGWFIVTAFASLALLHLLGPQKSMGAGPVSGITLDFVYAIGAALLLIGMGHIETLFSEREQSRWSEESLRRKWESQIKEETVALARTNQELLEELARRDQAGTALEESEARYRSLFMENPQPMWVLDLRSCRFLAVNKAVLRQYGFTADEFMTLTGRDLLLPSAAAEFLQDVSKPCPGVESRGIWQHCKKDGTLIDVEISAVDLKFGEVSARLFLANDITRRRRREMEVRKAHKLEIIGQVAGGVAHHFNNILAIIEGHVSVLLEKPLDLKSAEQVEHISATVGRAANLTRQLLAAGGRQLINPAPVDLNGLIRNMTPLLRRLAGERIALDNTFSWLPPALADRQSVERVIVNLVLNARDAMPNGGKLTFRTAKVHLDEDAVESGHSGKSGDFIRLAVRDTGCGMTPQVQSRLFEPFFTTKGPGKGLGLGLASVYGLVKQQGGWIEFTTHARVGTEFKIFLPCAPESTNTDATPAAPAKGTILLVEAEERTRALARFVLDRHGYRIIEADCAATALVLWAGQGASVDLLLTDMNFPNGLSGCDLALQLRQSRPGLKVVYTSGANGDTADQDPALWEGLKIISKPYSPDTLLQAVQDSLDS